jgi:peroxidase
VAFGNPDLLPQVGLGAVLQSLSAEREYRNDEQIDNTLRSVLFEVPRPGTTDPAACQVPVVDPLCFSGVADLGALDVERGRDHGLPSYNDLRRAYGLDAKRSFTAITGEATDQFPADPMIDSANAINDPNILDFVELRDADGNVLDPADPGTQEEAVSGVRRTTTAARLRAIYGNVSKVDAFVGMVAEPHVRGSEFGSLQLAIWRTQFAALRDGDRFYFANDPALATIKRAYGVTFRHTLAELVQMDSDAQVPADVFTVAEAPAATVAAPAAAPALAVPNAAPSTEVTSPDTIPTTSIPTDPTTVATPSESAPVTTPSTTSEPVTVPSTSVPESTTSPPVPATTVPETSTTSPPAPPTSAPPPP